MINSLERIELLIGKDNIQKLKSKTVLIAGVGGVGSFVCEALSRSGIGKIIIVDFDTIDKSNLNRQLMTTKDNIGKSKVEELKNRIEKISNAEIDIIETFIDEKFEIPNVDYVIDCIDTLTSKFELVKKANEKNIPIISSLGSAKRIKIENIKLTTLDKTRNDPLAKAFRNLVKKENYRKKIEVVYVDSPPIKQQEDNKLLGSSIFVVGSVGLFIANVVYLRLLERD